MVEYALVNLRIADGTQNFKPIIFSSLAGIAKHDLLCMHAIRDYRMQCEYKGNLIPFATAPKVI
jgi:hypothetical protein